MNFEFKLADGAGDLMTRPSTDEVGPDNYILKRDWRTELDQEVRREGDQLFAPKGGGQGTQATPNYPDTDEANTLIFTARQDNGKTALIVGTPTTLYRYYALDDQLIVAAGIVAAGILGTISDGTWLVIGSGFSPSGHRWEALNVGGYAVFNNGVDPLQTYVLNEFTVKPNYELREVGVAYVGTIVEIAGILMCLDIAEIHEDQLPAVMTGAGYGTYGDDTAIDRVHYRALWGDPVSVLRWGAEVPGAMTAGDRTLTLDYALASLQPGDKITVIGAGEDGADLITTIGYSAGPTTWILMDQAGTTVTEAVVTKTDSAALIVGDYDLLDDSSPALRAVKLQDRVVIAKSTGFIIGEYTGDPSMPFAFTRFYSGTEGLFWRWTMVEIAGAILYAGADDFYLFDLVSRQPQRHPRLTLCRDIFFGQVGSASQDAVFAADNGLTKEIWFSFPSASSDKVLAYDYRARALGGDRCQTIGAAYSAAAMVEKPLSTITHGAADEWFVLGTAIGTLLQYGMDRSGPLVWTRQGANYNSDIWPGVADFEDPLNEKHIAQYLLLLASQSPTATITLGFWGVRNPGEALTELPGSPITFATPQTQNTVYMHYLVHLIQERIRVTGSVNVRISKRIWSISRTGGASFQRR